MLFDFEDRCFDTPTLDSAMSWREQVLLSLALHLLVVLLVLFVPQLAFVRDAQARRAERLAEQAELQALAQAQVPSPETGRPFIFVQPRVDLEAPDARPDAPFSDQDRRAQSALASRDPRNRLPNALGNSMDFVEADDPSATLDDEPRIGVPADASSPVPGDAPEPDPRVDDLLAAAAEVPPSESPEVPEPDEEAPDAEPTEEAEPSPEELLAAGALTVPRSSGQRRDPDPPNTRSELSSDGLLGGTLRNLDRYVRRESFGNVYGDSGDFAPWIQFDTKGVEFGPWLRRFIAQVRRNWFIPYAALSMHGNVQLTFIVQRDGTLEELTVQRPSRVDAFTNSAFNALKSSNPTRPLPVEYPDDHAFFTITFYFNESPPSA